MKHSLQTVNDDIAELSHNFEDLSLENDRLRKELQKQWSRQDYMESQGRRQNVFHNMPKKRPNETWDDCERAVREVIKDKLKIGADIQMDRAHCVGSLIIIRLQNGKDKDLILKNAHNLKQQDTNVGISEDFRARKHPWSLASFWHLMACLHLTQKADRSSRSADRVQTTHVLPTVNNSTWTAKCELTVSATQATVACGRREQKVQWAARKVFRS